MNDLRLIPLDHIVVGKRIRDVTEHQIEAIKASVLDIGLLNPITVYPRLITEGGVNVEGYGLVAGMHRLEVFRRIGYDEIPAHVVKLSDLERQIAECDENLCGTQLTATEKALFTNRRKQAYEALHPETRREATLKRGEETPSRQIGETGKVDRFTADTAAKTGLSERVVQRDAERGEKIIPEVLQMVKGTKLDTGTYLDKIKRLTPNEQMTATKRDLAYSRQEQAREGGIRGRIAPKTETPVSHPDVFARFLKLVDEIEALPIAAVIAGSGRQRAVLGQRASGLADRMSDIMEGLDR